MQRYGQYNKHHRILITYLILAFGFTLALSNASYAQYYVMNGNFHIHSNFSCDYTRLEPNFPYWDVDHRFAGSPTDNVIAAKNNALDIVGFSEHGGKITYPDEWNQLGAIAAAHTSAGDTIVLRGFEFTGSDHMNVFSTTDFCDDTGTQNWDGTPPSFVDGITGLYNWLSQRSSQCPVAQFNHPWYCKDMTKNCFDHYEHWTPVLDNIICLLEIGGATNPFDNDLESYERPIDGQQYFDWALCKGWHVAPTIGRDNQGTVDFDASRLKCTPLSRQLSA